MPTRDDYDRELAILEAHAAVMRRQRDQIDLLTIRLALARGQWVGLRDRLRLKEIETAYPEWRE